MDKAAVIQSIQQQFPGAIVEDTPGWIVLKKEFLAYVFRFLKDAPAAFSSLHSITAVDRKDRVEVVYHIYSFQHRLMLTVKVVLLNEDLAIDSLTMLWEAANWLEREVFDLFGVRFTGHPDLRRILNPDAWTEHPLRKDFKRADVIPLPVR